MNELISKGIKAKETAMKLSQLNSSSKNNILLSAANELTKRADEILAANDIDVKKAVANNMKLSLVDRLKLTKDRIDSIANGLEKLVQLEDPIGEVLWMKVRPNGLKVGQKRVPLGVIGMIYESRPNVTVDAFGLCFKTGNAVILRGGSDAINSNKKIVEIIQSALEKNDVPKECVQLIEDTSRETALEMMKLNDYLDVLIPRGGEGLIQTVVKNSTVPVIETGVGNCHIYIDESADINMAVEIVHNAKTQRPGVCNACESLVIHKNIAEEILPKMYDKLAKKNVEIRGDAIVKSIIPSVNTATEDDWGKEYLDYIISIKVVSSIDEAINHINMYSTRHSESIITKDYNNAERFLNEIDSAAVYVNASTRFTDGYEFGFGAEIGISTQKLHARGPMGLKELTTTKYIIYGNGQIRE